MGFLAVCIIISYAEKIGKCYLAIDLALSTFLIKKCRCTMQFALLSGRLKNEGCHKTVHSEDKDFQANLSEFQGTSLMSA